MGYDNHFHPTQHSVTSDPSTNLIYVFSKGQLWQITVHEKPLRVKLLAAITNVQSWPKLLHVNKQIHVIGGQSTHYIFDTTIAPIGRFADIQHELPIDHRHFLGNAIYSDVHKSVILFDTEHSNIHRFNSQLDRWSRSRITWPSYSYLRDATIVQCADNNYLIALGGYSNQSDGSLRDCIFVYDFRTQTFSESAIKCPERGIFHAAIAKNEPLDEVIVFRFNEYFASSASMVQLIASFVATEWIHLIRYGNGQHWKLRVDEILGITL